MTEVAEPASARRWLSRVEAAEYIGAPNLRWMRRAVDMGLIKAHKRNRLLRFRVDQLDAYMAETEIDNSGEQR